MIATCWHEQSGRCCLRVNGSAACDNAIFSRRYVRFTGGGAKPPPACGFFSMARRDIFMCLALVPASFLVLPDISFAYCSAIGLPLLFRRNMAWRGSGDMAAVAPENNGGVDNEMLRCSSRNGV